MKKIGLLILTGIIVMLNGGKVIAQDEVYTYSMLNNAPDQSANFAFNLSPVSVDVYVLNLSIGGSGDLSYRIKNRFTLKGSARYSYWDRINEPYDMENSTREHGYSARQTTPAIHLEALGEMHFISKMVDVEEYIMIKEVSKNHQRTRYLMKVPAKRMVLGSLRAGIMKSSSYISSANGNVLFKGYHVNGGSEATAKEFTGDLYNTMMDSKIFVVGFSKKRVRDLAVKVKDVGIRTNRSVNELYLDFLYASNVSLNDMLIPDSFSGSFFNYQLYNVNSLTEKSKYGFRAGMSYSSLETFGLSYGAEAGVRPGPKDIYGNSYLILKMGIAINARL